MLFKFYKEQFYTPDHSQLRPNNFENLSTYFVQKVSDFEILWLTHWFMQSVITALSTVKDSNGYTPPEVLEFLIDLLKNNDNTLNQVFELNQPTIDWFDITYSMRTITT